MVIKSSEIFYDEIVNKLEKIFKKKLNYFPLKYNDPKISYDDIENFKSTELFKNYKLEIEKIVNF